MRQSPTILIMDEDAEVLEQLQTALQREGYQVHVAVDGYAALRLVQNFQPDLIVSDLLLAGMDGYEVWKTIRLDKEIPKIPVLVTSALTIPPNNETWRPTAGAEWQILYYDAALPKPIDLPRFVRVTEKLLYPDRAGHIPGGPSAIIASDDDTIRKTLVDLLSGHDFGLKAPRTFNEAIQLAKSIPPAALIIDYHNADQESSETIKAAIRRAKNYAPNTVVILIVSPEQSLEPEVSERCDGFLTLPLHPIYTITHLKQILKLYNMQRRNQSLSSHLIATNRELLGIQQGLQAQNQELQLINTQLQGLGNSQETFAGMMVHDLKSPLGAIMGTINFLMTDPDLNLSPVNENLLNGAVAAGNQMLRLVETLLEGNRIELGKFKPLPEPFAIASMVDMSLEQIQPFLELHNLTLQTDFPEDLPYIYADTGTARRIVENLLDNAIKYAPGGSTIVLEAISNGDFVQVSISDDGPGIPSDQKPYVFDRLALLRKTGHAPARSGFGLALNFCYLAAQALGGNIWVESDGEMGATFIFTLPALKGD
ncbi:MAG: hybrid sensor histidine kinase/response regulator [Anaerolineae bacterium]|nr:hybrid sensor histidine kinase/response regulator [Anaerolineae bacterium]